MKRILYLLLFVLVFFSSYVFSESPVCSFAVISDLHLVDTDSIAMEKFEMVVEKIKGQNVDIIFITGDIILPADEAKFRKIISDAGVPVYITFGNNDFPSRNRLRKIFSDLAISDYYHFLYKNSLFICLCDAINDHVGHLESEYISPGQIEYLERGLSEYNRKVDHIFIFAHIPLSQDGSAGRMFISTNDQKFLREMIERYRITAMFFGHLHSNTEFKVGNTEIVVVPAVFQGLSPQFLKVNVFKDRIEMEYR